MMFIFVMLGLVLCKELAGSSAVTTVFVQKGKDLHLHVNKPVVIPEYDEFSWRVNDTGSIVRLSPDNKVRIVDPYKGRVEFSVQNHSLILKNVQHSDSGEYTALIAGDETQRVAEYKVIIQDPVSPVNLSVNSVSNSTESCNLTVTCSTEDSLINSTFTCDKQTCHQEGGEQSTNTTSGSYLHVYLLNEFIICKHSNQVSCTSNKTEIQPLCSLTGSQSISLCLMKTVMISVGLIIMVSAVISVHLMKRLKKQE
ncbi:CD48 antigen-like [Scomber japonicus]|uniref:CD48 antigen-like n=1 Tax=Scomber japonicus TaxID=13676 RepID=UPI002305F685|nr:CD48 antigen-like [Scomber japonicus]